MQNRAASRQVSKLAQRLTMYAYQAFVHFLRAWTTLFASAVGVRFANWQAARRISRFSDYRLKDIGLERDWDGSINLQKLDLEAGDMLHRKE